MRPCLVDDLLAGARRLALVPAPDRPALARRLLSEAHAAHHFMRRFGGPHPRWGNGSLMTRALADSGPHSAPLCLWSLATMARAVAEFRTENAARRHGLSPGPKLCYAEGLSEEDHGGNQGKTHIA